MSQINSHCFHFANYRKVKAATGGSRSGSELLREEFSNGEPGIGLFSIKFVKTTIVGGLLFLLPIVVVSIILGYAMQLAGKVAQPIAKLLPDAVVGIGGITVLAVVLLVLL